MSKPKPSRVSLRADDAITAMVALRSAIDRLDESLALNPAPDDTYSHQWRSDMLATYLRLCKTLGLKPMVDAVANDPTSAL